jgi:hypothetical protein
MTAASEIMNPHLFYYLFFLIAGNTCLLWGLFLTHRTWRPEVPHTYKRIAFEALFHPERFALPDRLREIRFWNRLGIVLLAAALAVIVADIIDSINMPRKAHHLP